MVLQLREKRAKSTKTTKRKISFKKKVVGKTGWRSYHFVAQQVGKEKLDFCIENNVIETQGCSRTGSTKKEFQECWWSEDTTIGEAVDGTHQTLIKRGRQTQSKLSVMFLDLEDTSQKGTVKQ